VLLAMSAAFKVFGGGAIGDAIFGHQFDKNVAAAISAIQGAAGVGGGAGPGAGVGIGGADAGSGGGARGPQLPSGALRGSKEAIDRILRTQARNEPTVKLMREQLKELRELNRRRAQQAVVEFGMFPN
jgi:hypothetical protein